jgi:1-acyl-sn-glycerol-3-phosphate acyltransferase
VRRDWTYRLVIRGFRLLFRVLGLRFALRGVEHIPAQGAAVLASNHLSYLDFTFVGLAALWGGRSGKVTAQKQAF